MASGRARRIRAGLVGAWRAVPPGRALRVAAYAATWAVLTAVAFVLVLLGSSRDVTVLSHDAVVRPTLSLSGGGSVVVHTGPVLPDVRLPSHSAFGLDVTLGKTDVGTLGELVRRYAYLAGSSEGEQAKLRVTVRDLVVDAALRAAAITSR